VTISVVTNVIIKVTSSIPKEHNEIGGEEMNDRYQRSGSRILLDTGRRGVPPVVIAIASDIEWANIMTIALNSFAESRSAVPS
jgi:hypothetical protein